MKVKDIKLYPNSIKLRVVLPEMTEDFQCIYVKPSDYLEAEVGNILVYENEIVLLIK